MISWISWRSFNRIKIPGKQYIRQSRSIIVPAKKIFFTIPIPVNRAGSCYLRIAESTVESLLRTELV